MRPLGNGRSGIGVGVGVAGIPGAVGFRRLGVIGPAPSYLLGLLVAAPAAVVIVVPNL